MTDPNTPAPDASQPTPPPPAYGEYAPTTPPAATPPAYEQPAYQQPAYSAAPAYDASAGYAAAPGAPVPGKTLGIVALVLAIVPIGLQLVGLILGIVALVQSKKAGKKNGIALAAIIVSSVLIVIGIIVAIAIGAWLATSGADLVNQVNACLDDPTGTIVYQGITMSCEEVLSNSGR
ncbi:MAG: hypothetical protein ABS62_13620 [Microbacterium sp. SCN 70-200]|uniref:DUF4190 domain-containing protein n=1 Tax=unclassified Microbacterium TaxID=2609290 RepID=UPI000869322E|nr:MULTISPECIES: DUF4190 domain-containing protein [unclassified Microbacterium]ODT39325.1 MAG: hypothetical protein ABS62_13620 [Microbacterium sp. SCN 70-200]OJV82859.1 MAG: hypothetical protein BGO46_01015 [Microbacterium sp. 70-16]